VLWLAVGLSSASGFRAGPAVLTPKRSAPLLARATPLLSAKASAELPALSSPARFAALPALVAGSVVAMPALALASAGAAGEHLHLGQKIALFLKGTGLPNWAILVLVSMLPAVELRGGVPVGNWLGLSPVATFMICVAGNMLPIAPTLLALRSDFVKKLAAPLLKRAESKLKGLPSGQSRTLALALFVGVPAPGTGAWTGAIIAYLLDMPFGTAMASIFAGVILAGVIMTILTLAGKTGALFALAALCVAGFGAISTSLSKETADAPAEEAQPESEAPESSA